MNFASFSVLMGMLFSAAFTSCQKGEKNETELRQMDMRNVAYGNDSSQILDIFLPAGRDTANTKVILFIHGGSWSSGDKNEFDEAIKALRPRLSNFAFFNMNYRLSRNGNNQFPAQINDVESAINFITSKSGEYRINANKFCLVGASAGAHLALLQSYANNNQGKIKAVVDLFGPADLTDLYKNHPVPAEARAVLANFLGATPASNPKLYNHASPINFINAQTIPTKIFQGKADIVVPVAQSIALKAKLDANNVKSDLTIYKNEGHGWFGDNLLDTYQKTINFIKENVR